MTYKVIFTKSAQEELDKLPKIVGLIVLSKFDQKIISHE